MFLVTLSVRRSQIQCVQRRYKLAKQPFPIVQYILNAKKTCYLSFAVYNIHCRNSINTYVSCDIKYTEKPNTVCLKKTEKENITLDFFERNKL